jgi:hypothetical protein
LAYASAGFSIIGSITLLLFYGLEAPRIFAGDTTSPQVFGPLSDYAGLFQFLFMLPLPVVLHQLAATRVRRLSWLGAGLGVAGLLTYALSQTLLVTHVIGIEINIPMVLVGLVLISAWLIIANRLGRAGGVLPPRLAALGELTGIALMVLSSIALLLMLVNARDSSAMAHLGAFTQQQPWLIGIAVVVLLPGLVAFFIAVPIWLIWVGRRLLANTYATAAV